MADRYFSFDGETYQTHETADDAQREAAKALDFWRQETIADGKWSKMVGAIAWGEIYEHAPADIAASKNPWGDMVGLIAKFDEAKRLLVMERLLRRAGVTVNMEKIIATGDPWQSVADFLDELDDEDGER